MSRIHLLSLFSVLPLVACGGGEDEIVVEGEHYNYVVSEAKVPTSNVEATEFGLDLNGAAETGAFVRRTHGFPSLATFGRRPTCWRFVGARS